MRSLWKDMWLDFVIGGLIVIMALGVHLYRLGEQHGREAQIELMAAQCAEGCMIYEGEYAR